MWIYLVCKETLGKWVSPTTHSSNSLWYHPDKTASHDKDNGIEIGRLYIISGNLSIFEGLLVLKYPSLIWSMLLSNIYFNSPQATNVITKNLIWSTWRTSGCSLLQDTKATLTNDYFPIILILLATWPPSPWLFHTVIRGFFFPHFCLSFAKKDNLKNLTRKNRDSVDTRHKRPGWPHEKCNNQATEKELSIILSEGMLKCYYRNWKPW